MHMTSTLKFMLISIFFADGGVSEDQQSTADSWCYQGCVETPSQWSKLPDTQCAGSQQSPIDIDTSVVTLNSTLKTFTFANFSNPHSMSYITNTGHTVKCVLMKNTVVLKDGGLNGEYYVAELHFHWGNSTYPGSEHTVDKKRYQMEMHIVSQKKGLTLEEAKKDREGIAVLGFFLNASESAQNKDEKEMYEAWTNLTSYLSNISKLNATVNICHPISISSLLGKTDLTKFYRYSGSLTTPACNEAVVWTVFQEPVKVHEDVMSLFPIAMKYEHVYRPTQELKGRKIYASPAIAPDTGDSWCYQNCEYSVDKWKSLPNSQCGGERQSPISISTAKVTLDSSLKDFIFDNFSHPRSISHLKNTGHTVNCMLAKNVLAVSGGGLKHQYSTLQFHFHWGNSSDTSAGSEHSVDSEKYPMEMHIVSVKQGLTLEEAEEQSEGLAVLGFFIEVTDSVQVEHQGYGSGPSDQSINEQNKDKCWRKLTSYLKEIQKKGSTIEVNDEISLDCLLGDVDRSKYYRYNGSLTTPACSEAVVWTIFKQPVKVSKDLVKMFPDLMGYSNVFRPVQPLSNRKVYTNTASVATTPVLPLLLVVLVHWPVGQ